MDRFWRWFFNLKFNKFVVHFVIGAIGFVVCVVSYAMWKIVNYLWPFIDMPATLAVIAITALVSYLVGWIVILPVSVYYETKDLHDD